MSETASLGSEFWRFQDPHFLWLFLFLPLLFWLEKKIRRPSLVFSSLSLAKKIQPGFRVRLYPILFWLRFMALVLLILVLARPQKGRKSVEVLSQGVDIFMVIDSSGSMRAEDFSLEGKRVNRMVALQTVASEFVKKRASDRIGLVVFGTMAFTQCPLTLDQGILLQFLQDMEIGMAGEQTAIGLAIGTATNRLKNLEAKSRIMILLTDGAQTAGDIDPIQAATIAKSFGIKIYTIGIGSEGEAPVLVQTPFGPQYQYVKSDLDEKTLKEVAKISEGRYYRAQNTEELTRIYEEIDTLEKTKAKTRDYVEKKEYFLPLLALALLFLLLEITLQSTVLRRFP